MALRPLLYRPAPCPRRLLCPACYSPGEDAFNIGIAYTSHTENIRSCSAVRVIRPRSAIEPCGEALSKLSCYWLELRGLQS